jgi:hypothetical protein
MTAATALEALANAGANGGTWGSLGLRNHRRPPNTVRFESRRARSTDRKPSTTLGCPAVLQCGSPSGGGMNAKDSVAEGGVGIIEFSRSACPAEWEVYEAAQRLPHDDDGRRQKRAAEVSLAQGMIAAIATGGYWVRCVPFNSLRSQVIDDPAVLHLLRLRIRTPTRWDVELYGTELLNFRVFRVERLSAFSKPHTSEPESVEPKLTRGEERVLAAISALWGGRTPAGMMVVERDRQINGWLTNQRLGGLSNRTIRAAIRRLGLA